MDAGVVRELPRGLRITETGMYVPTQLFDTAAGGTGFAGEFTIVCDVSHIVVQSFRLELDWADIEDWLDTGVDRNGAPDSYGVPGRGDLTFHKRLVINDRLKRRFRYSDQLRGILLGTSGIAIPEQITSGQIVSGQFVLVTSLGDRFTSKLAIRVDRTYRSAGVRHSGMSGEPASTMNTSIATDDSDKDKGTVH